MAESMESERCEYLNVRHAKLESKDPSSESTVPSKIYKVGCSERARRKDDKWFMCSLACS